MSEEMTTDEIVNRHEQFLLNPDAPEFKGFCNARWRRVCDDTMR